MLLAARCDDDEGGGVLGSGEASWYRAMIARANYLAQDRMDLQYASKELSRRMSRPRVIDVERLKRFVRYLVGAEKVVQKFARLRVRPNFVDVFCGQRLGGMHFDPPVNKRGSSSIRRVCVEDLQFNTG